MHDRQTSMAYAVCRGVARSRARNFYYAFLILPAHKRDALCAVYAFMRHADDLSDDPGLTLDQRRSRLVDWAECLHHALSGGAVDDPVILALADSVRRFHIPLEYFDRLVQGTMMDLRFEPPADALGSHALYRTFEELYDYCYHVASVVGLVCVHIFGFDEPRAKELAEKTGIAFQLTNILRDVKEDAIMGRVYLPVEDFERFGLSPALLAPAATDNGFHPAVLVPLLEFEAARAREYYRAAESLVPLVHRDSQAALWALVEIYRRLLEKIITRKYDVFGERIGLSVPEKLWVLAQGMAKAVF
jgi:phytoene synthase